jgi:hypothetical protein
MVKKNQADENATGCDLSGRSDIPADADVSGALFFIHQIRETDECGYVCITNFKVGQRWKQMERI